MLQHAPGDTLSKIGDDNMPSDINSRQRNEEKRRRAQDLLKQILDLDLPNGALKTAVRHAYDITEEGTRPTLNNAKIVNMKVGQELSDPNHRGCVIKRTSENGWMWYFRTTDGKGSTLQVMVPIGPYPKIDIEEAHNIHGQLRYLRQHSDTAFTEIRDGRRRARTAQDLLRMTDPAEGMTMADLATKFLTEYVDVLKRPSSVQGDHRRLNMYIIDAPIGAKLVSEVASADLREIITDKATDALREAEQIYAVFNTMFNTAFGNNRRLDVRWLDADRLPNPMRDVKRPVVTKKKVTAITAQKAKLYYENLDCLGSPYTDAARLQLLCATRVREAARLEWDEIDLDEGTWTLPAERAKNNTEHLIYLSTQALDILRALPQSGRYVFPSKRYEDEPISEETLSKAISANRKKLRVPASFTSHQVRHAFTTWCAEEDISKEIRDRCTNHKPPASVDSHYNDAKLNVPAKRTWQQWANVLTGVEEETATGDINAETIAQALRLVANNGELK